MRRAILGVLGALMLTASVAVAEDAIRWQTDYRAAAEQAAKERKLVLLHFESDDCAPCRRLTANVFSRQDVAETMSAYFVPVKVNVARYPEMARRFGIASWPQEVIVTPMGQEVYRQRCQQEADKYIAALKSAASQGAASTARNATTPPAKTAAQPTGYEPAPSKSKTPSPDLSSEFQSPLIENGSPTAYEAKAAEPQVNEYVARPTGHDRPAANPSPATNDSDYQPAGPARGQDVASEYQPAKAPAESSTRPPLDPVRPPADLAKSPSDKPAETHKAPIMPPIGMEGYCVVTLHQYNKKVAEIQASGAPPEQQRAAIAALQGWVKGSKKFGAIHRSRLYLFATAETQKTFLADPDRFAPALSGYDAVVFRETGKLVEGKRNFGLTTGNGQVYLFSCKECLEKFEATPNPYVETEYQAMLKSDEFSKRR